MTAPRPLSPAATMRVRKVAREWARQHRGCTQERPWLRGAPPAPEWLPGLGTMLEITPAPKWPLELRSARHTHGIVTAAIGVPHDEHRPRWSLVPWQCASGWALWVYDETLARSVVQRTAEIEAFGAPRRVRFAGAWRVKTPQVMDRGRKRVRLDVVTPVCIRTDGRTTMHAHTQPSADVLLRALTSDSSAVLNRIGWPGVDVSDARVELVSRHTQAEHVDLCGKLGTVTGFVGELVLEANAPARWLLALAERVGLGGRTAYGFGRVRVSHVASAG